MLNGKNSFCTEMRKGLAVFACALLVLLILSGCNSTPKVYHVGILTCINYFASIPDGFKEGMAKLGYVENKNIVYDIKKLPGEVESEIQPIIEKFIADKVDLIVVAPTDAALKAKAATKGTGIPVVFATAFTEGNDLVESIRQPGGNITGIRWPSSPELDVKNLELLHEMLPEARRLCIFYQKDYTTLKEQLEVLRVAAKGAGMTLVEVPLRNVEDLRTDLNIRDKKSDSGMDVIMFIGEPIATSAEGLEIINRFAAKHKVPIVGPNTDTSFFSLMPQPFKSGKQTAYLADKVLKGTRAGTIPVLTVDNYLTVYYKTIQKLGLKVNENLLNQADEVVR
jgi:putative ABC transport system substrate-binding protein